MKRAFGFILIGLLFAGCEANETGAYAKRVSSPDELIGGPKALGGMGDWLIGNNKIRIIIQDQGWSRGFGVFGGGILDADLVRPGADATANGGKGRDNFGEFFPALFMQAFDVQDQWVYDPVTGDPIQVPGIEILNDGSDGKAAVIRTR
ncbi:hypothetical protein KAI87_10640, partial [Myxococcota bacterium]|nr:hypothetical protein [Myxococcota bacterium]